MSSCLPVVIRFDLSKYFTNTTAYPHHPCACHIDYNGIPGDLRGFPRGANASASPTRDEQKTRWIKAEAYQRGNRAGRNCYICETRTHRHIWEPCENFEDCKIDGMLGFRPGVVSGDTYCNQEIYGTKYPSSILTSAQVFFRSFSQPGLYIIAILLLIMSLTSFGCALLSTIFAINRHLIGRT